MKIFGIIITTQSEFKEQMKRVHEDLLQENKSLRSFMSQLALKRPDISVNELMNRNIELEKQMIMLQRECDKRFKAAQEKVNELKRMALNGGLDL